MLLKQLFLAVIVFLGTGIALASGNAPENVPQSTPAITKQSPWQFEVGISAGRPTPIMLNAGIGYENIFFRVMGGGFHLDADKYWVGFRGSLAWKFFRELPFSLDLGIGSGYSFAKAPNQINKALNRANGKRFVRSYNFKESLDISAEVRANIYGVFTQIGIPVHYFMKHDEPTVLWQVGYAYRF